MPRLLIAGATGLVGGAVLARALADPRIGHIVAPTRRPLTPHAKLENVVLDFAALPEAAPWWAVDAVVSALGTTRAQTPDAATYRAIDHDYPLTIARHARAHGAASLAVVSSLGADPRSRFAYPRLKGETERDLAALGYPSLTIARPSVLGGREGTTRFGERAFERALGALAPVLPVAWRVSPAEAVAAALLDAVLAEAPGKRVLTNGEMLMVGA